MPNQQDDRTHVVVTGMGVVTAIGDNIPDYMESLQKGRSGITRWKHIDERFQSKIGADLSDLNLEEHLQRVGREYPVELVQKARKLLRATPLAGRLSALAAMQAIHDAGLADSRIDSERCAHVLAGHNLNSHYIFENTLTFQDEPEFIDPLYGVMFLDTDVLSVISELLELKGPSHTIGGACASGNVALLSGLDMLRSGRADAALITGGAFTVEPVLLQGWSMIEALAVRSFNEHPECASRPFDARREGFVPGHGSGAVVLETLASARARDAQIYAEFLGGSSVSDASRMTKPDLQGQVRAMRGALADARIAPDQVGYVNAHATSTPLGDAVEVAAIKTALGARAYEIPINATKSMTGHCLSSAGVLEFIATVLQMGNHFVHPTLNQEVHDPELDLDFVPNVARDADISVGLSNSFGFGGINASVVLGAKP